MGREQKVRSERCGKLRQLDLKSVKVRKAIAVAKDAATLFSGTLAKDY